MGHDSHKAVVGGQVRRILSTPHFIILCASNGSVHVLDHSCKILRTLELGQHIASENSCLILGDNLIVVGDITGNVSSWNLQDGARLTDWHSREVPVTGLVLLDAAKSLLACSYSDGLIELVENGTGTIRQKLCGHSSFVLHLLFSADECRLLSAGSDSDICIWIPDGTQTDYHCAFNTPAQLVRWVGNDKKLFATGSRKDFQNIQIWNVVNGTSVSTLKVPRHTKKLLSIEAYPLLPDSAINSLITSHEDGSVRIWDCDKGLQLYAFDTSKRARMLLPVAPANVYKRFGHEDIHRIITGHRHGTVKLWRIPAPGLGKPDLDCENIPSPKGERLIKKSHKAKYFYGIADITVLETPTGAAIAINRVRRLVEPSDEGEPLSISDEDDDVQTPTGLEVRDAFELKAEEPPSTLKNVTETELHVYHLNAEAW